MKNFLLLIIASISLIACNDEVSSPIVSSDSNIVRSKHYLEVVRKIGGDFSGFNLGDQYKIASKIFAEENLVEKEADYLFYKFEETYTNSEYQISFSENRLNEIYLDTYVYDETGTFDRKASSILFNEIKEDFLKKFGKKYMETSDEKNKILYWSMGKKNIQLIHEISKAAVHVYIDISDFKE